MNKKTVICIDDEKIVLDSLKKELQEYFVNDFDIEIAESAEEALEVLEELQLDNNEIPIVISDYLMPKQKGDKLLIEVHKLLPKTLTIMLTGQATIEGVTNAINHAGLYRYISKPWETTDLLLTVKEALNSYHKDNELEQKRLALEEANDKLLKLDKAKSYFLGLLSHELNTPLIGINGNAKLISELADDADIKESAIEILASEARLRKFADLSLLITRIQTEKYDTKFYEESLQDIIKQSIFNIKDKADSKNIILESNLTDQDKRIDVDISLVLKVFEFILDNAIKFSPENDAVAIQSFVEKDKYVIRITDHGTGFSEKSLENLFNFFASTDDLMSHSEGTGLSLAAAKVIMDMHNFSISAWNSDPIGATVEMRF